MSLNNIEERVYDLISKKLSGDADVDSLVELNDIIKKHPEFQFLHDQLIKLNNHPDDQNLSFTDQAFAANYVKIIYANEERLQDPTRQNELFLHQGRGIKKYLTVCLSAALIIATFIFYDRLNMQSSPKTESSIVAADTRSKVVLPDGTTVILNKGSKLDYSKGFSGKERKVILNGEAYFDVSHNPSKPFIVHTSTADIRVYGTQFNVKNYNEETWETTLLTGKVEVLVNNAAQEKIILKPSQKLSIGNQILKTNERSPRRNEDNMVISQYTKLESQIAETSWTQDKMIFVDKPLHEIAIELERQFDIKVSFQSEDTKTYRYTGVFSNQSLTEVLQILDISRPIKYRLDNNKLQID